MCCCFLCLNLHDDLPNIPVDHNTSVRNFLRARCLSVIYAGIYCPGIFRGHPPERKLHDAGGVVSIAHHSWMTMHQSFLKFLSLPCIILKKRIYD